MLSAAATRAAALTPMRGFAAGVRRAAVSTAASSTAAPFPPTNRRRAASTARHATADAGSAAAAEAADAPPAEPLGSPSPPDPTIPGAAPFNIPLGIGLASAAFEAYMEPVGRDPTLAFVDAAGAATAYVSRPTLAAAASGALAVTLVSAAGLPAADVLGKSDPYAVVTCGASSFTSSVVSNSLAPEWNEAFTLYTPPASGGAAPPPPAPVLTVSVFDSDKLSTDDALGTGSVSLADLGAAPGGEAVEVVVPLTIAAGVKGGSGDGPATVTLRVAAKALDETFLSAATAGEFGSAVDSEDVARMGAAWRQLARVSGDVAADLFEAVAYIDHGASDTQLLVGANFKRRALGMAFRGTEMDKIKDVLTDLKAVPTDFDPAAPLPAEARATKKPAAAPPADAWTHSGFTEGYRAVRGAAFRVLAEAMRAGDAADGGKAGKPWTLYFCGHSLGGALATLAAYEAAHTELADGAIKQIFLYNYGSPRVGSAAFKDAFDAAVPDAWRVINRADIIPRVPRLLGYAHVGHVVCLNRDGTFDHDHKDDALFEEGSGSLDAAKVFAAKVVEGKDAVLDTLSQEWSLAKGVVTGEALQDHRERMYMETLRAVVEGFTGEASDSEAAREARADAALGKAE